jgi:hypothetical protein
VHYWRGDCSDNRQMGALGDLDVERSRPERRHLGCVSRRPAGMSIGCMPVTLTLGLSWRRRHDVKNNERKACRDDRGEWGGSEMLLLRMG